VRVQNNKRIQTRMWGYNITGGYKTECEDKRRNAGINIELGYKRNVRVQNNTKIQNRMRG
jgi:hypothetical protein